MNHTSEIIFAEIFRAVGEQFHVALNMQISHHPKCTRLVFADLDDLSIKPKLFLAIQDCIEECLYAFGFCNHAYRDVGKHPKWFEWVYSSGLAIVDETAEPCVMTEETIRDTVKKTIKEYIVAKKQSYQTEYQLLSTKLRELGEERDDIVKILASM